MSTGVRGAGRDGEVGYARAVTARQHLSPPLLRLMRQFSPDASRMALAVSLQFATIAAAVALMATSAWLISRAALRPSIAVLALAVVGVRLFGIARGVFRYLERVVSHDLTLRLLGRMRDWVYTCLEPLSPAWLVHQRSGDVLNRIVADVDSLDVVYVRVIGPVAAAILTVALVVALLLPHDIGTAAAAACGLVIVGVGSSWIARRVGRSAGRDAVQLRAELEALVVDGVQGLADLVAFGQAPRHARTIDATSTRLARAQVRAASAGALGGALASLGADLTALLVLALGAAAVTAGRLDGVQLAVAVLLALAAFEAVAPVPAAWQATAGARAAAARLFELADEAPARGATEGPLVVPSASVVDVRRLTFSYPGATRPALEDVSLRLEPGRLVAVVGPSGSGKSTLASLLVRFWDGPEGSIRVGGVDVRHVDADDLRSRIALVPQRVHLFTGTIEDNVRLACPDASEADLERALSKAELAALVASLPDGLRTWIGEQGQELSGGERRRLALARALLKPAPLLVLDEPTAHVDLQTAGVLLANIRAEAGGRGVLLVTHRLAGLDMADEILVLRAGRVVERGTWHELAAGGGWFARMLQMQAGQLDGPDAPAAIGRAAEPLASAAEPINAATHSRGAPEAPRAAVHTV
jgi:ATP-binding cassette, subfamily C, bacterial CydC